ncbi:hypothetical protein ACSBR1_006050 [Camellia fascicularis]
MGLTGKLVRQVEIKSDGDVFHELFRDKPHHISTMSPGNIHGVDLHEGDYGQIKSDGDVFHELFRHKPHHISTMSPGDMVLICMNVIGDMLALSSLGTVLMKVAKVVVEAIDEENKSVTHKVIDGDLTELYKAFKGTVHVDTKGENNLVTWTFEYEKKSENVEDPNTLMDFLINVTKDIETHQLK